MKATIENLNDPEWWDLNAPKDATHWGERGLWFKEHGENTWYQWGLITDYNPLIGNTEKRAGWRLYPEREFRSQVMHKRPDHIADASKKIKMSDRYPAYFKDVSGLDEVDVYAVHDIFGVDDPSGCIQHASKKLLLCAKRTGGKDMATEIKEARDTLTRKLQLMGVE